MSRPPDDPGSLHSVVLVPALEVGHLVRELRMEHDPSAAAGVPPHVTLMYPFLPPPRLSPRVVDELARTIGAARAFDFALTRVEEFAQGVLYLAPEPAATFVDLTRQVGRQFGLLPFGGEFGADAIPHLTVAMNETKQRRREIEGRLRRALPIALRADEAWLMVGSNENGWTTARRMPLAS